MTIVDALKTKNDSFINCGIFYKGKRLAWSNDKWTIYAVYSANKFIFETDNEELAVEKLLED